MEKIKTLSLKRETVKKLNVQSGVKTGTGTYRIYESTTGQSSGVHSSSLATTTFLGGLLNGDG